MSELLYKIKNRRGPASEWASVAPVLAAGEFGIESDTGKIKIGDGVTAWPLLPYLTDHDHDAAYAAIAHDHDEAYSAIAHDHDEAYSGIDHDHDEAYSAITHDHDEAYSGIDHDHAGIGDALTIKGVTVDDADLSDGRILAYDESGDGSLVYIDPPEGGGAVAPLDYWKRPGISFDFPDWLKFSNMGLVEGWGHRFGGAVVHPNGLIYCFPGDLNNTAPELMYKIAIIDPAAESCRLVNIADPGSSQPDIWGKKYLAATLGKDGRIYLIPENWAGKILVFDPDTEITTVQAVSITAGGPIDPSSYGDTGINSVVCAPDGSLWCIPGVFSGSYACDHFIKINTSDFTASAYVNGDGYKFGRSFLAPDGYIYASPKGQNKMLRIDPASNTITTIDIPVATCRGDAVSDQYGRIWIPELTSTALDTVVVVYDPADEEYRKAAGGIGRRYAIDLPVPWFWDPTNPPDPSSAANIGGLQRSILGSNGLIYCVQSEPLQEWGSGDYGLYVLEIDPGSLVTDPDTLEATVKSRYLFATHAAFDNSYNDIVRGLISLPDGRFMSLPMGDGFSRFMIADPTIKIINPEGLISAHINKI